MEAKYIHELTSLPTAIAATDLNVIDKDNGDTTYTSYKVSYEVLKQYLLIVDSVSKTDSATLALTDAGKVVECNKATAMVITVPPNSSVAFPVGTIMEITQIGAGSVTIAAGVGVTIHSLAGDLQVAGQYASVTLRKRATNEWMLTGALI